MKFRIRRIARKVGVIHPARAIHKPDNLRFWMVMMGQRVAQAHIAEASDQNSGHLTAPEVMPRISWREKMT